MVLCKSKNQPITVLPYHGEPRNELVSHALAASLLLRPWMRPVLFHQLRINLHRAYIPMSQHIPDRMYIRAVLQKVRREGVPKGVGSDVLYNARHLLIMLYDFPEALTGHVLPADVDEEGLLVRS